MFLHNFNSLVAYKSSFFYFSDSTGNLHCTKRNRKTSIDHKESHREAIFQLIFEETNKFLVIIEFEFLNLK